ncbi:predicted membrane protein [Microbacterium testaceum StLB037]|uniref:Predicted membrane protein n=1 Tax=Microbacterium testaceum (strain StLB037) TaxID=979556 RepID=E8NAT0_MICTS|nr:TRIC cation channel family protein [Microbacterium testaceum]BAJ75947.1 predicted membrane protein [Microbacterium testaceum StLB037]
MTLTVRASGTAARAVPGRPSLGARAFAALDIVATAVRGVEGAALAAHAGFDLLGVLVVGFVAAVVGGMLRDVLLGDLPPAALRSSSRIIVAFAASGATFVLLKLVDEVPTTVLLTLDGVGLALFAVIGAQKASAHGASLWVVVVVGVVAATGGGVVRDVLLGHTPVLLTQSVYGGAAAVGALATGILLVTTRRAHLSIVVGFVLAFALRETVLLLG